MSGLDQSRGDVARWLICGMIVLLAHGGLAAAMVNWTEPVESAEPSAAIVVMLAPISAAPAPPTEDIPPGPEQVQAEAAVEKTVEPTKEPELERTPDAEIVVASTPPKPDPTESDNSPPAPVTSAPQAQQMAIAPVPAAPNQGVMKPSQATSVPRWSSRIAAALERNKRYPADASRRRQHGVARVAFSIDRKGYVLASRIVHGSGSAALDEETLALLQRAQPFPPPPPELAGDRIDLVVPVRFDLR